jgi:NADH-quinone oxidoreductase subunit L
MLGIAGIFSIYQTVDLSTFFLMTPYMLSQVFNFFTYEFSIISVIGFLLFIGAVGKSAQLGLHT